MADQMYPVARDLQVIGAVKKTVHQLNIQAAYSNHYTGYLPAAGRLFRQLQGFLKEHFQKIYPLIFDSADCSRTVLHNLC